MTYRLIACLCAVLAIGLFGACSGDDDASETPLPSGRTAAPEPPGGAGPISKQASKFLGGVDGKYVYRYTGPLGGVTEGTLTVYRLGVNDRNDWTATAFEIEATTISILGSEKNYVCTKAQNFDSCQEASVAGVEAVRVISSPIYDALAALVVDPDQFEVSDLPERSVSGTTAKCYHAFSETRIGDGPPSSEEIEACYADSGAVLYFQRIVTPDSAAIEPGTYTIEAQEIGQALPSDFEPTSPAQ